MTSTTAPGWPTSADGFGQPESKFLNWIRSRPFWGGLLAMISGLPILYFPYAHLTLGGMSLAMSTTAGAGALIIGLMMIVLGATAWFQPLVRVFCGVAVTILALISIPVANLGGFGMGLIPGLIAGGLLCAWAPLPVAPAAEAPTLAESAVAESVAHEATEAPAAAGTAGHQEPAHHTPESDDPAQELGANT